MRYLNSTWTKLFLVSLLGVLLLGCGTQSSNLELQAGIKIPDLPASVRHTKPEVPSVANNAAETRPVLEAYEKADRKNAEAIAAARSHNRNLQKLYNKPAKKVESSSWVSGTFPSPPTFYNPFTAR